MPEESSYSVYAQGISKRYGAVHALSDVTFELKPGEVMALLGENGAGKSTLVKILSGLVKVDSGTIKINGVDTDIDSSSASQAAGIAVVQQEYSTVGTLSVAENLLLGQSGTPRWWGVRYLHRHAREMLARVGLEHIDSRTLVEDLSVAEMQLLEIARVLSRDVRILIFDEPTAALSDSEIARVLRLIKSLAAEGKSVVYVTHRLREVFEIADRVTIFRNGLSGPAADVAELDVDQIIARMLGRELGAMYPPHQDDPADGGLVVEGLVTPGVETPIDLKIGRGQILGLTGQLGSGASFALQAIAGVMPVLAGSVSIDGKELNLKSRRAGIRAGVAYCSADRKKDGIFVGLSMERNLSSPWLDRVSNYGMVSRRKENIAAAEIGEQFMIDQARLRSSVGTLSGGNQQKVAVGKWLGVKPSVLLVNEPTRGVDVGARAEIYRQLRTLCDGGLIVVVCSSDTNEIFGLCDVIGSFYRGQLSALRPYSEWTEAKLVSEVMRGKVEGA